MPDGPEVRRMFASVAPRYDRANHLLSLGIDHWWRRAAVKLAGVGPGSRVLDVCAGTGDLAVALAKTGARVVGSDFCPEMLAGAAPKRVRGEELPWLAADAMQLPFADASFDAVTVAFGIRNVADPVVALRDMARVTRPGGRVVVLEFARPRWPLVGRAYLFYFRRVLPTLGGWITGERSAYEYLPNSVMAFPERDDFLQLMRRAGLESPRYRILTGGIAALYHADAGR